MTEKLAAEQQQQRREVDSTRAAIREVTTTENQKKIPCYLQAAPIAGPSRRKRPSAPEENQEIAENDEDAQFPQLLARTNGTALSAQSATLRTNQDEQPSSASTWLRRSISR